MFGAVKRWWLWLWSGDVLPERERTMIERLYQSVGTLGERLDELGSDTAGLAEHVYELAKATAARLDALAQRLEIEANARLVDWHHLHKDVGAANDAVAHHHHDWELVRQRLDVLERWARRVATLMAPVDPVAPAPPPACKTCGDTGFTERHWGTDAFPCSETTPCPSCRPAQTQKREA